MMILSLIISCLFGFGNVQPLVYDHTQNQVNNVEIESKQRKELLKDFGYIVVSPYELFTNNDFYNSLNNEFLYSNVIGNTYSLPYFISENKIVNWAYCNYEQGGSETTDFGYSYAGQSITSLSLELITSTSSNYGSRYRQYTISLDTSVGYIDYSVRLLFNDSSTNTSFISVEEFSLINSNIGNYHLFFVGTSRSWLYGLYNMNDDYDAGYNNGYELGYNRGYDEGYNLGYDNGVDIGEGNAQEPSSSIYQTIYQNGYQTGYSEGLEEGQDLDTTAAVIFSGFIEVGLLPVNVLLKMFEYEVFGINIAGLISGLFTLAIGIIIIRTITGKKND